MVTTKLQGGLGNQMFQIAVAYAHAKDIGTDCAFDFDGCHTPNQGYTSLKYKNNFFNNFNQVNNLDSGRLIWVEQGFKYTPIPKPIIENKDVELIGFFQSEKYFKKYKEEVITLFNNFNVRHKHDILSYLYNIYDKSNRERNVITVHVRRGDYVTSLPTQEFHTNLADTSDYYQKAMGEFSDSDFVFVSDDIQWCKDNFKGDNIFYSPFKNELDDLCLMSLSHGNIIANSSFSWWGAYLSQNEKIITPKQWFGPRGPKDTETITPDNWIKI